MKSIKPKLFFITLVVVLVCFLPKFVGAQSLWAKANSRPVRSNLFSDKKAIQVGDIITILIVESSTASQTASTQTSKQTALNGGVKSLLDWEGMGGILPTWDISTKNDFQGDGTTTRRGSIQARISATIKKVLPNGNFLIEGRRNIRVNDEKQNIVITGTVRPDDIKADNTVESTYVADAQILYEGKGPLTEKQKPGIVTRLLDWLHLF